jgi:CHAD domain-containing protein
MDLVTQEMLGESAEHGARAIAHEYLQHAVKRAAPLLVPPATADAAAAERTSADVHDFRVALRRLRTWLRVCKKPLDEIVPKKRRRALRRISRCAGRARDVEVERSWFGESQLPGADAATLAAASHFRNRLDKKELKRVDRLRRAIASDWPVVAEQLGNDLSHDAPEGAGDKFGPHLAGALRDELEELRQTAGTRPRTSDVRAIHKTRIAAKHLRYLLESFEPKLGRGTRTLSLLTGAQEKIGALHDQQLVAKRIDKEISAKGANGGIVKLRRIARQRIRDATPAARKTAAALSQPQIGRDVGALATRCERRPRRLR